MVAGRRSVGIEDASAWVFNRMADVYDARPPYPDALIDRVAEFAGPAGSRVGDIGAGTGHFTLPLAARGFHVTAVDPAEKMLAVLRERGRSRGVTIDVVHAAAEALPLESNSLELVLVSDALHFIDAELSAIELGRILMPQGALAIVTSEFGDTRFMRAVVDVMERAAPRRPRDMSRAVVQTFVTTGVRREREEKFFDETPVDDERLERILRSISFIGPAMNETRFAAFRTEIRALPQPKVWARAFTLTAGRRRGREAAIGAKRDA
jgi:ubiquinone/menaquinone biosynthesis C-methylase UbiE